MIAIIFTLYLAPIWSQVNTESMRGEHTTPGFSQNMALSFAYISGNSKLIFFNASYRIDYASKSNWYGFLATKYDRAFEKSKDDFSNKGFGQLRVVKQIFPKIQIEGFLQKEFNYFIDLENRELIGGGLRFNPVEKFYIGTGSMNEKEIYQNNEEEQNFWKSTSYLNYSFQIMEKFTIQQILYYQFKLSALDNYRILWDGKFSFQGFDWLSFYLNIHYRYDISDNINSEGGSYFELTNGFGFHF